MKWQGRHSGPLVDFLSEAKHGRIVSRLRCEPCGYRTARFVSRKLTLWSCCLLCGFVYWLICFSLKIDSLLQKRRKINSFVFICNMSIVVAHVFWICMETTFMYVFAKLYIFHMAFFGKFSSNNWNVSLKNSHRPFQFIYPWIPTWQLAPRMYIRTQRIHNIILYMSLQVFLFSSFWWNIFLLRCVYVWKTPNSITQRNKFPLLGVFPSPAPTRIWFYFNNSMSASRRVINQQITEQTWGRTLSTSPADTFSSSEHHLCSHQ